MLTLINKLTPNSFFHNQKWTDEGIEFTPGSSGMMWGPYINLESGEYVCRILVRDILNYAEAMFSYDVCADHGRKILINRSPLSKDDQGLYINLVLLDPVDNIEFRIYHSGEHSETITGVEISRCDNQPMKMFADTFLIEKSENLFKQMSTMQLDSKKSDDEVRILQTSDANRYAEILAMSSAINKNYSQRWGLTYEAFSGIIFGEKPFQATYNRTALLWFLMKRGYCGWVLYLDADAAFSDFDFDFKTYLLNKRNNGKHFVFHPVFDKGNSSQFFGHVNAGVFAIDLSSPIAKTLISIWYSFYREYYCDYDYDKADKWTDLMDDQASLQRILFKNRKFFEPYIDFDGIQHSYVFQALRSDEANESSMDDLHFRINKLRKLGAKLGVNI